MRADEVGAQAFDLPGGDYGCLLLHGFSGTAGQMRWLGEQLNAQGYTVTAPMLPGHGQMLDAMRRSNWEQWLNCARTSYVALKNRCEHVCVIGLSMGGALGLILAEEYPVDALITLSAAIRVRARFSWTASLIALFAPYRRWAVDEKRTKSRDFLHQYDYGYDGMPLNRVRDLVKIMRLAERNLFAVVAPTLVIQPENDETVDPRSAEIIINGISSREKRLVMLPKSGHMCVLDCDRKQVLDVILFHLRNTTDTKSLANSDEKHV